MSSTNFYSQPMAPPSAAAPFAPYGMGSQNASYREPLTLRETVERHIEYAFHGIYDALNWKESLTLVTEDAEIQAHVMRSAILNALSITSVVTFNFFIMPLLDPKNEKWFHRHFEALYQATWLAPLVAVSLYLNLHWCSMVANRAFSLKHGRQAVSASPYTGMVAHIASSAYRAILIASYLLLTFVLTYIPYIGSVITFLYICWVNSYYCFEYLWIARGMTLSQRVKHEEERWAYYLAFGFPSAIACMWGSSLANAAIFAFLFPWFILQSMHASPVPTNPWSPSSTGNPMSPSHDTGSGPPVSPHDLIPVRLRVFAPVIIVNDALVRLLSVTGTSRATKRSLGLQSMASEGEGDLLGGGMQTPLDPVGAGLAPLKSYGYTSPISTTGGNATYRVVRRRKAD